MGVVRRMIGAQVYSVVRWLWLGWFVGGFDCAIVFVVLGDARPLLHSPCNTLSFGAWSRSQLQLKKMVAVSEGQQEN